MLALLEASALERSQVSCLLVDWEGVRIAVLGKLPPVEPPSPGAQAVPGWVPLALQGGKGAFTGRLWAPAEEVPQPGRLEEVGALFARLLTLQSERDVAVKKLRHVERAVRGANVGLWEWDLRTGRARSGNHWPALLGYGPGEVQMSYAGWVSLVHPDDLPATEAALQAFLSAPEPGRLRVEYRLRHRSGQWRWTLSLGDIVRREPDGTPRLVAGSHQDIHAQKASELALMESEAYARNLFDSSPDCIMVVGLDGVVLDLSAGGLSLLGLQGRDQLVGLAWPSLWPEPYGQLAAQALADAGAGGSARFRGFMAVAGEQRWWDVFAAPLRDPDGSIRRVLVTSRDVSEQVATEETLRGVTFHMEELVERQTAEIRGNEARLRSVLSNLDGMAYRWEAVAGRPVHFVSDGARQLLGLAPAALASADGLLQGFVHEEDRARVREAWEAIGNTGVHEHEFRIVDAQGRLRWIHERLCVVKGDTGCVDAMLKDVTERRDMLRDLALANHTLEESLVSVFWLDERGCGLRANRATAELLGYSREELQQLDLTRMHPDLGGERWQQLRQAIRARGPQQLHVKLRVRDGRELPVFVFITSVQFEGREIYVGFASDESSRLEDQRARKESDLLSRAALGALASRIAILDRNGIVLATNRAWEQGSPASSDRPRAVVGSNWLEKIALSKHPAAAAIREGLVDVVQERELTFELEYAYTDVDDPAPVWMQLRATRFGSGDDLRVVVAIEDISRHKRIQLALDRSRRLFETLCTAAPVVIFQADAEGACRFLSTHWGTLTGREVSEDLGFGWLRAIAPQDYASLRADWLDVKDTGHHLVAECRLRHADGREVNVYIQAVRLRAMAGRGEETGWVGTITDLTDIKAASRELVRVERRQREVLQSLPVFVYVLRPSAEGTVEPAWLSSPTDLLGHRFDAGLPTRAWWMGQVHPEDAPRVFPALERRLETGVRWSFEYRLRRPDGSYAWVADHMHAIRDEDGTLIEVIGSLTDVSDRYAAEAAFRESEAQLRVAFEQAAVGMAHLEAGRVMRPNRRLLDMTGHLDAGQAPQAWDTWTHPEDRERDAALLKELLQGSATAGSLDKRLLRVDGSDIWVHVAYSVIEADNGHARRIFAVVEDTSERRRIQGAANQALSTLDAIAEATFSFDPESLNIFYVNEGALRQSAYTRAALLSSSLPDLLEPSARSWFMSLLAAAAASPDRNHRLETELVRRDGSRLPVEMAVQYIRSAEQPPFCLAVTRDITERREARLRLEELNAELEERVEQRTDALHATNLLLRNKEEQIRAIVENIPSCVITIDRDGIITSGNAAVSTVFGIPVSSAIGRELDELIPGLFEQVFRAHLWHEGVADASGGPLLLKGAFEGLAATGETRALEVSVGSYELRGEPQYAAIIRDVRDELAAKHELLRARMEAEQASRAKSAFLATMSHEIRTPMNGVLGMSELLLQSPLQGGDREMVETIQQSASTLLDLLDDILDFSKIEAGKLDMETQPVELERMVEAVCATHAAVAAAKNVELRAFVAPDTPRTVDADPVRVRQVLHNLIGNAIKFSAGREDQEGRVDVRVRAHAHRDRSLEVTLEVRDNGIGMTQEVLERVFQPFTQAEGATTRRFGGTGLGLSICKRLVELMAGEIVCHSLPGQGTVFTIAFRFDEGRWQPSVVAAPRGNAPMTLVVSTDPVFRADAAACLQAMRLPHEVFERGEDMAHWLGREPGPPPLVICGPGDEDGAQLRRMAAAVCGCQPAQVMWSPGPRQRDGQPDAGGVALGRVVLSMRTLDDAVATALGRPPADASQPPAIDACFVGDGIRLLIAEDHDINQRVIQRQLHRLGVRGDIVGDGEQALDAWRRGEYDAILADLHMPRMDGYTLARRIREEEAVRGLPRIPIIAFTANAIIGDEAKCFEAGMDDVVTKPVELERLREVLTRWLLSPPEGGGPGAGVRGASAAGGAPARHADVRVLQQLVGDDPEVVSDFLRDFTNGATLLMRSLHALVPSDGWREARGIVHRLKSSARAVGAARMGALCEEIEELAGTDEASKDQVMAVLVALEDEWAHVDRELALYVESRS